MLIIPDNGELKEKLKACFIKAVETGSVLHLIDSLNYLNNWGDRTGWNGRPVGEARVILSSGWDLGDYGLGLEFQKILPLKERMEQGIDSDSPEAYRTYLTGGLVYHESSNEWGVHT